MLFLPGTPGCLFPTGLGVLKSQEAGFGCQGQCSFLQEQMAEGLWCADTAVGAHAVVVVKACSNNNNKKKQRNVMYFGANLECQS